MSSSSLNHWWFLIFHKGVKSWHPATQFKVWQSQNPRLKSCIFKWISWLSDLFLGVMIGVFEWGSRPIKKHQCRQPLTSLLFSSSFYSLGIKINHWILIILGNGSPILKQLEMIYGLETELKLRGSSWRAVDSNLLRHYIYGVLNVVKKKSWLY